MKPLTYGSLFSGTECMSAAARGLPLVPKFFAEVEPYPCAILRSKFPDVPNLGDVTKIKYDSERKELSNGYGTAIDLHDGLDILVGGSPCQDCSTAGLRKGADGDLCDDVGTTRSSLIFTYIRLLREIRPKWIIYENVPGLLTSNEGRDFAHFLVALAQCGYGDFAWRVLDAQYVRVDGMERAVPQRRRRVWLVGRLGENHGRAAEVLLEPYGDPGDFPPRRKTGEDVAGSPAARSGVHGGMVEGARRGGGDGDGRVCATVENHKSGSRVFETSVAATMGASRNANASNDNPLVIEGECVGFKSKPSEKARSLGIEREVSPCLSSATHDASAVVPNGKAPHVVAIDMDKNKPRNADKPDRKGGAGFGVSEKGVSYTLTATDQHAVCYDGYNQIASEEVCMTIRSAATGTEGNDADPKVCVSRSYGMNPQNGSQMFPCTEEVGQTLAVQHQGGVIHRTESESNCLTPGDPLTKRVYASDGIAPTMMSIAKNSGISTQSFVLPPQTDETLPEIVVRRLTPAECERLMGLPDGWTRVTFTPEQIADPDIIAYFRRVHDDWQKMNAVGGKTPKPKTEKFVIDWLTRISDPETCPDAPRYKVCGNGMCANQVRWILLNLLRSEGIDPWYPEDGETVGKRQKRKGK